MALINPGATTKFWGAPANNLALPTSSITVVGRYRLNPGFTGNFALAQFGNVPLSAVAEIAAFNSGHEVVGRNSAGGSGTRSAGAISADGLWHMLAGAFTQTSISPSLDGGSYLTSAFSAGSATFSHFIVGSGGWAVNNSTSTTASVAEVSFWQGQLSQPKLAALYSGFSPLDVADGATDKLLAYYPLRVDTRDYSGNRSHLVPFGGAVAVYTDHPPVAPPRRRSLFRLADTGVHGVLATPGLGSAVVTGNAPVVAFDWVSSPGLGAAAFTGKQPSITTFGEAILNPGTCALAIVGFVPAIVGHPIGPPPVVGSGNDPYRPRDARMRAPFSILRRKTPEVGEQPEPPEYEEIEERPDDSITRLAAELDEREAQFQREQTARMMARSVRQASQAQTRERVRQSAAQAKAQADMAASIVRALASGQIFFGSGE